MAYNVIVTAPATQDLKKIITYLSIFLETPAAASSFADAAAACYSELEQMPFLFEFCRKPRLRALGYHKAVIKKYVMIYKVNESEKNVYILRFFHGSQDYENLL